MGDNLDLVIANFNHRKVIVKFIPCWLTELDFKRFYEQFGEIESYYMVKYKDQNVINYNVNSSYVGYIVFKDPQVC